jgi:UDP-N-acetylmuramate dehydrogenase
MKNTEKINKYTSALNQKGIMFQLNESLAPFTTWKIGGPAEVLIKVESIENLNTLLEINHKYKLPITIIGSGSNILISDKGIEGIVIINKIRTLSIDNIKQDSIVKNHDKLTARLDQIDTEKYYSFTDLDYDESDTPVISVNVGSGFYLPQLINVLIDKGITGLQWFAGIPGTIGGAVYNNIHGGSHFISEYIKSVKVLTPDLKIKEIHKNSIKFDYDYSSFHDSQDIILEVKLLLHKGDKNKARQTAIVWAQKKRLQPYKSAGCCFKNVTPEDTQKFNLDSSSWGYIIDKILGLKGKRVGDAIISPYHAAFIENLGKAKAQDVIDLFEIIYNKAYTKLGITPDLEIFLFGFDQEVIKRYSTSYSKHV